MPTADEIRGQQRQTWDRFSSGWMKWDHLVLGMLAPVGEEMIRALDIPDDAQHLDVAAGTGEPGLTIAARIPGARVTITDLAPGMLDAAAKNVTTRGLDNVELRECSVDDLPFDDAQFDTITCRFGFMFFPDLPAATSELVRVLKPGGRVCAAVWAQPDGNPWATIPMAAITGEVELPVPEPDAPGLFRCAAPGAIADVFETAGLRDVSETEVPATLSAATPEEYWDYMTEVAAPVVAGLAHVDDAARERIRARVLEQAREFEVDSQVLIPLHARCVVGTK